MARSATSTEPSSHLIVTRPSVCSIESDPATGGDTSLEEVGEVSCQRPRAALDPEIHRPARTGGLLRRVREQGHLVDRDARRSGRVPELCDRQELVGGTSFAKPAPDRLVVERRGVLRRLRVRRVDATLERVYLVGEGVEECELITVERRPVRQFTIADEPAHSVHAP